jgi:ribonuclease Z
MTDIVITGTGVPHLAPGRAGPGAFVRSGDVRLQFDAGRATALRLCEAGVRIQDLTALFVTHHHSDHLTGLTDLLFVRWLETPDRFVPLPVVAPNGPSTRFLEHMMDPWVDDLQVRTEHIGRTDRPDPEVHGFDVGEGPIVVWEDEGAGVRVTAQAVHHEPVTPAVAYRVDTPDGAVVISGDTIVCDEIADLAAGADVLVHEAFRRDALTPFFDARPHLRHIAAYHADTVELGAQAERIGIPRLVLTHLIPSPAPGFVTEEDFADDVRRGGYTGEVIVARDLTTVTLGRETT